MAHELLETRENEARDGTRVLLQHEHAKGVSGWFATQERRIPLSECRVGGRLAVSGRYYHVVAIVEPAGDDELRTVRVR